MSRAPVFAPGDPVVLTAGDYLWIARGAAGRVRRCSEGMALVAFDGGPVGWVSRHNLAIGVELEQQPEPVGCGAGSGEGRSCQLPAGHEGWHAGGGAEWPHAVPAEPVEIRRRSAVEQLHLLSGRLLRLAEAALTREDTGAAELFGVAAGLSVAVAELEREPGGEAACPDDPDGQHSVGCGCDDADLGWAP